MQTQLSNSNRVKELQAEIAAIADVPKANGEMAVKMAVALIACWPGQQAQDPMVAKAFMRQLTELLVGQDVDVLRSLLDPKGSFIPQHDFMPSIAKVSDFIEQRMDPKRSRIGWYLEEIEQIEGRKERYYDKSGKLVREMKVPDATDAEERERNVKKLRDVNALIKETAAKMQRASPPLPAWQATEEEAEEGRLKALEYNDSLRKAG